MKKSLCGLLTALWRYTNFVLFLLLVITSQVEAEDLISGTEKITDAEENQSLKQRYHGLDGISLENKDTICNTSIFVGASAHNAAGLHSSE